MIDSLFCFLTCLVRDNIRRRGEKKKPIRIKDCIATNEQKTEREGEKEIERENLQIEIVYLFSVYMGDLSLWRVLLEVIFCFLHVSSFIYRSYSPNDVVLVCIYVLQETS